LAVVSAITALGSSQLLYEFEVLDRYGDALRAAALATITGEPLAQPDGFAKVLDVVLASYSVVVFAALAVTLGAYFLEREGLRRQTQLS
jgi:voltage-gated potassium channel